MYTRASTSALKNNMIEEFMNRGDIHMPDVGKLINGCCRKTRKHKEYMWQHKRASDQTVKDFDMHEIIKKLRIFRVMLKSLMTKSQRQLSRHIASRAITDSESNTSCDDNRQLDYWQTVNPKHFDYLDSILENLNHKNRRLIIQYLDNEKMHDLHNDKVAHEKCKNNKVSVEIDGDLSMVQQVELAASDS